MKQTQEQITVNPGQPAPELLLRDGGWRLRLVDPEDQRVLYESPRFDTLDEVDGWRSTFVADIGAQIQTARAAAA
ncbi:MAG: hypothetical protein WCS88_03835 [Patescibacteria group bacterium]|jgi:hypothetical protein